MQKCAICVLLVCRHIFWLSIDPDYIFLMYFARCQLTVSIMLLLILGPKVRIRVKVHLLAFSTIRD